MNTDHLVLCVDLDNTITSDPLTFSRLMATLRTGGASVFVLSADSTAMTKLAGLGLRKSEHFDGVICVPVPKQYVPGAKVTAMRLLDADLLIDNSKPNTKAAARAGFTALRLYQKGDPK